MKSPEYRRLLKITAVYAVMACALAVLLACTTTAPPDTPPAIRGVVTSVEPSGDGGSLRVVWTKDPAVGPMTDLDAAQVAVTPETELLRLVGEGGEASYESLEFSQLKTGDVVEAWFDGPVAESYPVQANGDVVIVVGTFGGKLPVPPGLEPEPAP